MKYIMTPETRKINNHTLYRVQYADGSKGGWVESEHNLSQDGDCMVMDEACVFGKARVCGDALVSGNAWFYR
jgi:hypothetical protein